MKLERDDRLVIGFLLLMPVLIIVDLPPPAWVAGLLAPIIGTILWRASGVGLRATLSWTIPLAAGAVVIAIADEPAATLLIAGLQGVIVLAMQWPAVANRWVRLFESDRFR